MKTPSFRPLREANRGRAAIWLLVASTFAAACGQIVPTNGSLGPSPSPGASSGVIASATPLATKSLAPMSRVAFVGWIDGLPAVGIRDATAARPTWQVQALDPTGWHLVGELPDGSAPVTDGVTFANVPDPATGPDLAVSQPGGVPRDVSLPAAPWVAPWRGIQGLSPIGGSSGYLLSGAGAIATLDDQGGVVSTPVPAGFVALAPTSDPTRFLLASEQDASEPGALSESQPHAVYLWAVGSQGEPTVVRQSVVAVAPSTVGLAWLRSADGSWWSVNQAGGVEQATQPAAQRSSISPDGRNIVRYSDSVTGCAQDGLDPCLVTLSDANGSTVTFTGPASGGAGFGNGDVGIVLLARPALGLPWRLVHGPADKVLTTAIE